MKVAVVVTATPFAMAQSFDYPVDSPTLFQRGQQEGVPAQTPRGPHVLPQLQHQPVGQHLPVVQHLPTQHTVTTPLKPNTPSLLSRVFGGKKAKAKPTFGSAPAQVSLPGAQSGVQHSFHIDPYAINRNTAEGRNLGYQPQLPNQTTIRPVRPVGYDQPNQFEQQSILDRTPFRQTLPPSFSKEVDPLLEQFENVQRKFSASRKLDSGTNPIENSGNDANADKFIEVNFDRNTEAFAPPSTRPAKDLATTLPQSNGRSFEQSIEPHLEPTQPAVVVSQPATTPVAPTNAFTAEFEKAYRFIEPNNSKGNSAAPHVAQLEIAPGELQSGDFQPSRPNHEIRGDFVADNLSTIDVPDFIEPPQSEQSPNAAGPSFNPPSFDNEVDQLFISPAETNPTDLGRDEIIPIDIIPAEIKPTSQSQFNRSSEFNPDFAPRIVLTHPLGESAPPTTVRSEFPFSKSSSKSNSELSSELSSKSSSKSDLDEFGIDRNWVPPSSRKMAAVDAIDNFTQSFGQGESATPGNFGPSVSSIESALWWKPLVLQPFHPDNQTMPVNSNGLVFAALKNSPRIQAVSKNPLIRELQVVEADAEFDPVRFVQTQFQDRVDPVGNSLTIGGASDEQFLKENIWTGEAGIRRKLRTGADVSFSQQLGFQNSNSINFTPQDQGTATIALNVSQPLLRGRGRYYNQAQILIAQSTGGVAWEVFQRDLQEELEGVVVAYWDLYLQRSIYLQRKRNVERGEVILNRLNGRRGLDSLPAQISRAKSSVQTRRTELANAFRNVRNAETEIRRRIADRNWMVNQKVELLPNELPTIENVGFELEQVVHTALNHRPEIRETMRQIKIAGVRRDISENELLPELSFLVGTYISALQGESDVLGAFTDQFGEVTPGYSVGFEYELPRFNRAARSRFQQRHLQLQRLQNELEEVMQNVIAESQVSVRRIESAIETLKAATEAIMAARADIEQNERRWESFALIEGDIAEGVSPTTVLDQLLDSQERLSQTEVVYARAEQELKVAEVALQRSMGTLLMHERVSYNRIVTEDTPSVHLQRH